MINRNLQKFTLSIALASFLVGSLKAQKPAETSNEPIEAAAVYRKISALVKAGDFLAAHKLMTDEQSDREIGAVMVDLAADVASERPIPKKLEDGTQIDTTLADLGLDDSWNPPAWMKANKMSGSSDQWDALEADLIKQFKARPDRKAALSSLYLINRSLGGDSLFGEKIVAPRDGFEPRENRLWIVSEEEPNSPSPLIFEKQEGQWKFAGMDWETDDEVAAMWKFEEKKEHPIAGKGPHGEPVSLKGLKGKIVLIDFWGTW